jgi:hypothetical protein
MTDQGRKTDLIRVKICSICDAISCLSASPTPGNGVPNLKIVRGVRETCIEAVICHITIVNDQIGIHGPLPPFAPTVRIAFLD